MRRLLMIWVIKGDVAYEDFEGHKGTIGAGNLQWMTSRRGIVYSEMPASNGTKKGLHIWINLSYGLFCTAILWQ
ncbi:putative pirin domain, rmlC-like cupin domain superfamily, rmlC-like jelly roll [Helianthus annuus]|nr:putative pirin domain, rmlC-like cupin domain superfamily, rmlC-like jelly roll [Helianthus annuus]